MKFKNPFQKEKQNPFSNIEEGHVIVPAFVSGGVQYYQLKDMFNTFCARAMDALSVYEMWNQRCTRDFLVLHTQAQRKIKNEIKDLFTAKGGVFNLNLIFEKLRESEDLDAKIQERLDWALPTEEIIWQFAGIAFFDKNESPYKYDNKYCEEKIKRWKADNDIAPFFLSIPLKDLIPFPSFSEADLSALLTIINKMDRSHYERVTSILSSKVRSSDSSIRPSSEKSTTSTSLN